MKLRSNTSSTAIESRTRKNGTTSTTMASTKSLDHSSPRSSKTRSSNKPSPVSNNSNNNKRRSVMIIEKPAFKRRKIDNSDGFVDGGGLRKREKSMEKEQGSVSSRSKRYEERNKDELVKNSIDTKGAGKLSKILDDKKSKTKEKDEQKSNRRQPNEKYVDGMIAGQSAAAILARRLLLSPEKRSPVSMDLGTPLSYHDIVLRGENDDDSIIFVKEVSQKPIIDTRRIQRESVIYLGAITRKEKSKSPTQEETSAASTSKTSTAPPPSITSPTSKPASSPASPTGSPIAVPTITLNSFLRYDTPTIPLEGKNSTNFKISIGDVASIGSSASTVSSESSNNKKPSSNTMSVLAGLITRGVASAMGNVASKKSNNDASNNNNNNNNSKVPPKSSDNRSYIFGPPSSGVEEPRKLRRKREWMAKQTAKRTPGIPRSPTNGVWSSIGFKASDGPSTSMSSSTTFGGSMVKNYAHAPGAVPLLQIANLNRPWPPPAPPRPSRWGPPASQPWFAPMHQQYGPPQFLPPNGQILQHFGTRPPLFYPPPPVPLPPPRLVIPNIPIANIDNNASHQPPEASLINSTGPGVKRPIVVDGSNVAMSFGKNKYFDAKGILLCVRHFIESGHCVQVFLPQTRSEGSCNWHRYPTINGHLLSWLERNNLLTFTPHRNIDVDDKGNPCKRSYTCYDDYFIVEYASKVGGVIISRDNYRDVCRKYPEWAYVVNNRLLMFAWVGDEFMVPRDPLGAKGPSLEIFLQYQVGETQKLSKNGVEKDALIRRIDELLSKAK